MKITTLIITLCLIQVSAATRAQITLNEKKANLQKVLEKISTQSGYDFVYSTSDLKNLKVNNINLNNVTIEKALDACFTGQPLQYEIADKTVMIKKKEYKTGLIQPNDFSVAIEVKGKVVDESGKPLSGVTIKIKGTSTGVISDEDGLFSLTVPNDKSTITFSFIGFESQEMTAKGIATGSTIILKATLTNLQEVVVNKGYYTEKQLLNTGNVSSIKAEDIAKQPTNNPLQALEGRVAGMFIQQQSGIAGGQIKVQIRGQNSIENGNEPLYVVDGVPYMPGNVVRLGVLGSGNPLTYINSNDIESIDILKDADATSIYGSRGANGVVLITTKKGKIGKTTINVNFSNGFAFQPTPELLNTKEYLEMRNEAFRNDNIIPSAVRGDKGYAPDLKLWDTTRYTNWQKELVGKNAAFRDAQVSVSGGSATTQFLISGNYRSEKPVFPGPFSNSKGAASFNITNTSVDRKFKIQLSGNYVSDKNNLPKNNIASYTNIAPNAPNIFNPNGTLNWESNTFVNPYSVFLMPYSARVTNLNSNIITSYQLINGLDIKILGGYSNQQVNENTSQPTTSIPPSYNVTTGSASFATRNIKNWILEPQLSYKKSFSFGNFNLLFGGSLQNTSSEGLLIYAYGYTNDALLGSPDAASTLYNLSNNQYDYHYSSIFGRLNYNWKDKYILNVTTRRDGSSRFGPGRQFANFGSIGLAWLFTEEQIIKKTLPFISFGKLRGSYGTTGNDQIPDYSFLSLYSSNSATYQNTTGLNASGLYNPDYAWEANKKLEIGLELGFLENRIYFTGSFFRNRSGNQLLNTPLPSTTGFTGVLANLPAVVQNKGLELTFSTINVSNKDFSWKSNLNFTRYSNKLIDFPGLTTNPQYSTRYIIGQPLNVFRAYHSSGVDPQTGIYQFIDNKGQKTFTPSFLTDSYININRDPKFYGGLENSFRYKGVDLSFLLQYTEQMIYSDWLSNNAVAGTFNLNIPKTQYENRWQKVGDNSAYQRLTQSSSSAAANALSYARNSDLALINGSFLRLRNVMLSYSLQNSLLGKLHCEYFKIFIQGENLLTITSYRGRDPEGQNNNIIAPSRLLNLGVKLGF